MIFYLYFFLFLFPLKIFSKTTFSTNSININKEFFLNGNKIFIYGNKGFDSNVYDSDLKNSFFIFSNPQISNLNDYKIIDTKAFFDNISSEILKLEINAYLNSNNKKYYLIDFTLIDKENFPILSDYLINDFNGKKIGFEISYLMPLLLDFARKSKGGVIVVENTSKIENDQIDMNGKLNINSEDNLNGDLTVEIQSGSNDIKIGDNSTGNIFLGNLYGNSEINGNEIFINSIENLKIGISENKKIDPDGINYYYFMLDGDGNIYKSINPILKNTTQEGLVVDGNKTTITNTNLGLYGLIRINNDDFSKTAVGVDIRAGNKKISIGNSDTGDSVEETGNVTIGNTNGFTHLYGGPDFSIRTAGEGTGVLSLGYKNDNSKISIESGSNEINIGKDSTGNINIGNLINTQGFLNLNGKISVNAKSLDNNNDAYCFQLFLNDEILIKGYNTGDLTIGHTEKKLHLYGSEIWLIRNGGDFKIGDSAKNSKINLESGTNDINIGNNSTGNLNLGNSTGNIDLKAKSINFLIGDKALNLKNSYGAFYLDPGSNRLSIGNYSEGPLILGCGLVSPDPLPENYNPYTHIYGREITIASETTLNIGNKAGSYLSGAKTINIGTDNLTNINIGNKNGDLNLSGNINLKNGNLESTSVINLGTDSLPFRVNVLNIGLNSKLYNSTFLQLGNEKTTIVLNADKESGVYFTFGGGPGEDLLNNNFSGITFSEGSGILGNSDADKLNISMYGKNKLYINSDLYEITNSEFHLNFENYYLDSFSTANKINNPNGRDYYMLMLDSNGKIYRSNSAVLANTVSSKKYKKNIREGKVDIEKFKKLIPVIFDYVKEINSGKKNQWGLIAEDVYNLGLEEVVEFDENGEIYGLNYQSIFVMLLSSYLESLKKIEILEKKIFN